MSVCVSVCVCERERERERRREGGREPAMIRVYCEQSQSHRSLMVWILSEKERVLRKGVAKLICICKKIILPT